MKCPYCNKEIKELRIQRFPDSEWFVPNLVLSVFTIGMVVSWILPLDTEHGYSANYDLMIALGLIIVYIVYLLLYKFNKVKGRFVFVKQNEN